MEMHIYTCERGTANLIYAGDTLVGIGIGSDPQGPESYFLRANDGTMVGVGDMRREHLAALGGFNLLPAQELYDVAAKLRLAAAPTPPTEH